MSAPIYEKSPEITEIIKQLSEKRADLFGELFKTVFPEMIACGLRVDKECPAKQKWILKIEGIKGSKTLLTDKKYLIHGYLDKWDSCSATKKIAIVANMLRRIDYPTQEEVSELAQKGKDFEYGKLIKPEIQDFAVFLKALGVEWTDEDKDVPDITTDKSIKV